MNNKVVPTLTDEVLNKFGVTIIAHLSTQTNQHWLAELEGKRVILRRFGSKSICDINYELSVLEKIADLGWPVAPAISEPVEIDGYIWCLFPFLEGEPPSNHDQRAEQRTRGRLLAQFHADLAKLGSIGQRENWRRCEEILKDQRLDRILSENASLYQEEVDILKWHLDRARNRVERLDLEGQPGMLIHGDFAPWNLRYKNGHLSGIIDFELAHWDHRVGDFNLSWRGKYDEVIRGYNEISPLEPIELEMLTPVWWASLIDGACRHLAAGTRDDGWYLKKLLERSPLMGPDSIEYRP